MDQRGVRSTNVAFPFTPPSPARIVTNPFLQLFDQSCSSEAIRVEIEPHTAICPAKALNESPHTLSHLPEGGAMKNQSEPVAQASSLLDRQLNRRNFLGKSLKQGLIVAPATALILGVGTTQARAQFSYAVSDVTRVGPQGIRSCEGIQNPIERFFCILEKVLSGPRGGDPPGTTTGIRG